MKTKITHRLFAFCIFTSAVCPLTSYIASAQSPQKINYQAVARDASGNPMISTAIYVEFKIWRTTAGGILVYDETHTSVTTNLFGLFNLQVGGGSIVSGNFSAIQWGSDLYFLEVFVDPDAAGASPYVSMGTTQFLSVPYALHSATADSIVGGAGVLPWTKTAGNIYPTTLTDNVGIGTTTPLGQLHVSSPAGAANFEVEAGGTGLGLTSNINLRSKEDGIALTLRAGIVGGSSGLADQSGYLSFWTRPTSGGVLERMRIIANGNVGIGTTIPGYKLEVLDNTSSLLRLKTSAANTDVDLNGEPTGTGTFKIKSLTSNMLLFVDPTTAASTKALDMFIGANGGNPVRVMRMEANPFHRLRIHGQPDVTGGSGYADMEIESGNASVGMAIDPTNVASINWEAANMPLVFKSGVSFSGNRVTTGTELMRITFAGNVGIGTTAPSEKLDVVGNVRFSGALMPNNLAGTSGQVLTSAGAGAPPTWTNAPATITASNGLTKVSNDIQLGGTLTTTTTIANAGFNFNITGAGNVGIGTTTPAGYKLEALNTTPTGGAGSFTVNNASNSSYALYSTTTGTGVAGVFQVNNAASPAPALYAITNGTGPAGEFSGKIKINDGSAAINKILVSTDAVGTAQWQTPSAAAFGGWSLSGNSLSGSEFIGSTNAQDLVFRTGNIERFRIQNSPVQLLSASLGSAGSPVFSFNGDANTGIYSAAADALSFSTNGNERMRINASGNVGINTTAPGSLLHVFSSTASNTELKIQNNTPGFLRAELTFEQTTGRQWGIINEVTGFRIQDWTTAPGAWTAISSTTGSKNISLAPTEGSVGIGITSGFNGLFHVRQTGSGQNAGYFEINNAANGNAAVLGTTNSGSGNAGYFSVTNNTNSATALYVSHNGSGNSLLAANSGTGIAVYGNNSGTSGKAGYFEISNGANASDALGVLSWGTGRGGFFQIANAANPNDAIFATTNGSGYVVNAYNTGTGPAGLFQVSNTNSAADALTAYTDGKDSKALVVRHAGTSGTGIDYGVYSWINGTRGAGSTNVAGYFSAEGATNNYAIVVPSTGGNVGIGTTAPTNPLNVKTSAANIFVASIENQDATGWGLEVRTTDVSNARNALEVRTGGSSRFLVRNDGNVGIGTITPGAKLHMHEGHLKSTQNTAPSLTVISFGGFGGVTLDASSTDVKGFINVTGGSMPNGNSAEFRIDFNIPYTVAPVVVVTPAGTGMVSARLKCSVNVTATSVTIYVLNDSGMGVPSPVKFNYIVIE